MIKQILLWAGIALLVILLLFYFISGGGLSAVKKTASSIPSVREFFLNFFWNPDFKLPGQDTALNNLTVEFDTLTPFDMTGSSDTNTTSSSEGGGTVALSLGNVTSSNPAEEYVIISASAQNRGSINISGWSLQSTVTGKHITLPHAASPLILGVVNRVGNTVLPPGGSAVVTSGISPVGVSFEESRCTDLLQQQITQQVASAYNDCVNAYRNSSGFGRGSYRLYGEFTQELWNNDHDTIRLLDSSGNLIGAVSY